MLKYSLCFPVNPFVVRLIEDDFPIQKILVTKISLMQSLNYLKFRKIGVWGLYTNRSLEKSANLVWRRRKVFFLRENQNVSSSFHQLWWTTENLVNRPIGRLSKLFFCLLWLETLHNFPKFCQRVDLIPDDTLKFRKFWID